LSASFHFHLDDAIKRDPQCWAKNALVKALKQLGSTDAQLYLKGLRHFQLEPGFGGPNDTAVTLRGECGHALVQCYSLEEHMILTHLVDLLADPEPSPRIDAARAIGNLGHPDGALVLRMKIHCGDQRPEVIGACLAAFLDLERKQGVPFVASFLNSAVEDLRYEAAAALGESKEIEAFHALRESYEGSRDPRFREALLRSMGASLQAEAIQFLISLIQPDNLSRARDAIRALEPARYRDEVRAAVKAAVDAGRSDILAQAFQKTFRT
jgi:HEAT repeat protein